MPNVQRSATVTTRRRTDAVKKWTYNKERIDWRHTTTMNVRDLSNDDDFLSHMLVEKLGVGIVPLYVHRMDQIRRLPKTNADELLAIVRKLVASKSQRDNAAKQAVDDLLSLVPVQYYIRAYTQKQLNAFATHAFRYFEFYMPSGCIEIAHTSRYTHKTGKSELCILATRPLPTGMIITELKGSMADLTPEEEHRLKHGDPRGDGLGIRRDFSVIHSRAKKMNHLFLGPARFVNHDCKHNAELFRDGRCITFRTLRPIALGEEITTHYGNCYFGYKNKDCLCATCERLGKGGYSPNQGQEDDGVLLTKELADYESDSSIGIGSDEEVNVPVDVNERRTRRGVYHVNKDKGKRKAEVDSADSSDDEGNVDPTSSRRNLAMLESEPVLTPLPHLLASVPIASSAFASASASGAASAVCASSEVSASSSLSSIILDAPFPSTATLPPSFTSSMHIRPSSSRNISNPSAPNRALTSHAARVIPGFSMSWDPHNVHRLSTSSTSSSSSPTAVASTPDEWDALADVKGKGKAVWQVESSTSSSRSPSSAHSITPRKRFRLSSATDDSDTEPNINNGRARRERNGDDDDSDGDDDDEQISRRSLRHRKSLPERFYDLTKRRPPRKSLELDPSTLSSTFASASVEAPGEGDTTTFTPILVPETEPEAEPVQPLSKKRGRPLKNAESAIETPSVEVVQPPPDVHLPKCKVCASVIPVLFLDMVQIPWGPSDDDNSGEHECPRCLRHFHIYQARWPSRINKGGPSHILTPAANGTPVDLKFGSKVTKRSLPVINHKLAAVKAGPSKLGPGRNRDTPASDAEPPSKKRKVNDAAAVSSLSKRQTSQASEDAKDKDRSRSGRTRMPSAKVRTRDETPQPSAKRKPGRPRKHPMKAPVRAPTPAPDLGRGRGRPRKRAMTPVPVGSAAKSRIHALQVKMKAEKDLKAKNQAKAQAREASGRFGKGNKPQTQAQVQAQIVVKPQGGNGETSKSHTAKRLGREQRAAAREDIRKAQETQEAGGEQDNDEDEDEDEDDSGDEERAFGEYQSLKTVVETGWETDQEDDQEEVMERVAADADEQDTSEQQTYPPPPYSLAAVKKTPKMTTSAPRSGNMPAPSTTLKGSRSSQSAAPLSSRRKTSLSLQGRSSPPSAHAHPPPTSARPAMRAPPSMASITLSSSEEDSNDEVEIVKHTRPVKSTIGRPKATRRPSWHQPSQRPSISAGTGSSRARDIIDIDSSEENARPVKKACLNHESGNININASSNNATSGISAPVRLHLAKKWSTKPHVQPLTVQA